MVFLMAGIILALVMPIRAPWWPMALTIAATGVAAVLISSAPARAQAGVGRIAGRVTDESGAPIAEATVRAESPTASPGTLTSTTNERGEFAILGLRRGRWTITVTADGFEPTEMSLQVRSRMNVPSMRVALRRSRTRGTASRLSAVNVEALEAALGEADALVADDRIAEALALYGKLVEAVPALTSIHREMGDLYLRQKDRARALAAYQRRLDAEPDDEETGAAVAALALALGLEAEGAGDRDLAVRYLEQALAAAPDAPEAADARAALARLKKV